MAKFRERLKARLMRRKGISIVVIARNLRVSKSSVSDWCNDIVLTDRQIERLRKNQGISFSSGQRLGAQVNKNKKIKAIEMANDWGVKIVKNISKRELILISTALYWCEGSKTESTSSFVFVNSDPEMILVVKEFLTSALRVKPEDIVCRIQINIVHKNRVKKVLIFWKNLLKLDSGQIKKPYFVKTKVQKVYENHDNYQGVCRLIVKKSKFLKYKMLALIKALKVNILSA